ncbi:MAG: DUF3488 and transglutaminase-like domain-containing protein [Thermoguttaceae bacterium]|jgi:transglutaminase-like putative cysteine protease
MAGTSSPQTSSPRRIPRLDLPRLLSVNVAVLVSLATLFLGMGERSPWTPLLVWLAALAAVALCDFTGWFYLNRTAAAAAGLAAVVFSFRQLLHLGGDARILALADLLSYLQVILLFQKKDQHLYWELIGLSFLQVAVATSFNQGIWFGMLLVLWMLIGLSAMALVFLYGQWQACQTGRDLPPPAAAGNRWPLVAAAPVFVSSPAGTNRAGIVRELFARLGMIGIGTLILTLVIFFTIPRLGQPAWRGALLAKKHLVGFSDTVRLGQLGELMESDEEVMRVDFLDPTSRRQYPVQGEIYLRGAVLTHYQDSRWSRKSSLPSPFVGEGSGVRGDRLPRLPSQPAPVLERIAVEPSDHDNLCCMWPFLTADLPSSVRLETDPERLLRREGLSDQRLTFRLRTTALEHGVQLPLAPCQWPVPTERLLEMDDRKLPWLTALARQWAAESGLSARQPLEMAHSLEQHLSNSPRFQYSLEGQDRDTSVDAIEDFVHNHPRGHCEYFATALALMLRSQGIPARVVVGYKCDEWNDVGKFFQVRQLHAHAWVEAYIDPQHIPASPQGSATRQRWPLGGWLRLEATPAVSAAAGGPTAWRRLHRGVQGLESAWSNYIMEMDRQRQKETVFQPLVRAMSQALGDLRNPAWWRQKLAQIAARLGLVGHGIAGLLLRLLFPLAMVLLIVAGTVWLRRRAGPRTWRKADGRNTVEGRRRESRVEFYRQLEIVLARRGLVRSAAQTPREFARAAGAQLALDPGQAGLAPLPARIVEAFYRVRFGELPLDNEQAGAVEQALAMLASAALQFPSGGERL